MRSEVTILLALWRSFSWAARGLIKSLSGVIVLSGIVVNILGCIIEYLLNGLYEFKSL
jgi:hypothetical protein